MKTKLLIVTTFAGTFLIASGIITNFKSAESQQAPQQVIPETGDDNLDRYYNDKESDSTVGESKFLGTQKTTSPPLLQQVVQPTPIPKFTQNPYQETICENKGKFWGIDLRRALEDKVRRDYPEWFLHSAAVEKFPDNDLRNSSPRIWSDWSRQTREESVEDIDRTIEQAASLYVNLCLESGGKNLPSVKSLKDSLNL
jgi:hypothetical protein